MKNGWATWHFECDITEYLNTLNVKLQVQKQMITEMQDLVRRFKWNCLCGRARCAYLTFLFASQWHSHHPIPDLSVCQQIEHTESGIQQEISWFWNTEIQTWPVRESICSWCLHYTWTLAFGTHWILIHKDPVPVILGQLSLHLYSLNQCHIFTFTLHASFICMEAPTHVSRCSQ